MFNNADNVFFEEDCEPFTFCKRCRIEAGVGGVWSIRSPPWKRCGGWGDVVQAALAASGDHGGTPTRTTKRGSIKIDGEVPI